MAVLPLQVLRLHSLTSVQKSTDSAGAKASCSTSAQLNLAGLNLAFPACPTCAHKVTSSSHHGQWKCPNCRLDINQENVVWTFRLSLSFSSIPPLLNKGGSGGQLAKEIPASILGMTAQLFFGCTAAEWVQLVESTVRDVVESGAMVSVECLAQQMAVLADFVLFSSFSCFVADLRKGSSRLFAQHKVARIGAAKTHTGEALVPVITTLRWLWKLIVCESFPQARLDSGLSAAKPIDTLRVSDLFIASRCLATNIDLPRPDSTASDSIHIIDYQSVASTWEALDHTDTFCIYQSAKEPHRSQEHSLMDKAEVDQLFDHWSQLFFEESHHIAQNQSTANSPLEAQSLVDQSLSSHFLGESYYDECLQGLFVSSQKHLEAAGIARNTQQSLASNESFVFDDVDELMHAPSFSELIHGSISLSARSESPFLPPRTPNARANSVTPSAYTTPMRPVDGEEQQQVLAQETPTLQITPLSDSVLSRKGIFKENNSVKETPILRTRSISNMGYLSPSPNASAISGPSSSFVPETPAKEAGSRVYSKLTQPRPFKRHRSVLDKHSSAGLATRNNRRRLSSGVSKHNKYERPPRLRHLSDARMTAAVPETPAALARRSGARKADGQSDLPAFVKSNSTGTSK